MKDVLSFLWILGLLNLVYGSSLKDLIRELQINQHILSGVKEPGQHNLQPNEPNQIESTVNILPITDNSESSQNKPDISNAHIKDLPHSEDNGITLSHTNNKTELNENIKEYMDLTNTNQEDIPKTNDVKAKSRTTNTSLDDTNDMSCRLRQTMAWSECAGKIECENSCTSADTCMFPYCNSLGLCECSKAFCQNAQMCQFFRIECKGNFTCRDSNCFCE